MRAKPYHFILFGSICGALIAQSCYSWDSRAEPIEREVTVMDIGKEILGYLARDEKREIRGRG